MTGEWTAHCVKCGRINRMPRKACIWCGETIPEPEPVKASVAAEEGGEEAPAAPEWHIRSPRPPHNNLEKVDLGVHAVYRDPATQGVFMAHQVLDLLVKKQVESVQEDLAKQTKTQLRQTVQRGTGEAEITYINCPVCGGQMQRKNFMKVSGIVIDKCMAHGVWLDPNELQQIFTFIATGGKKLLEHMETEAAEAIVSKPRQSIRGGAMHIPGRAFISFRAGYWR